MTYEKWINQTNKEYSRQLEQRKGQFYFNSLYWKNSELADKIAGSEYDPYHRDDRIDLFLVYVYLNWKNGEEGKNGTLG